MERWNTPRTNSDDLLSPQMSVYGNLEGDQHKKEFSVSRMCHMHIAHLELLSEELCSQSYEICVGMAKGSGKKIMRSSPLFINKDKELDLTFSFQYLHHLKGPSELNTIRVMIQRRIKKQHKTFAHALVNLNEILQVGKMNRETKKMVSIPTKSTDSVIDIAYLTLSVATYSEDIESYEEALEWEEYFQAPERWSDGEESAASNSDDSSSSMDKENVVRAENPKILSEQIRKGNNMFIDSSSSASSSSSSSNNMKKKNEPNTHASWVPKVKSKLLSAVSHSRTAQHKTTEDRDLSLEFGEFGSETIFENQRADLSEESTEMCSPDSSPRSNQNNNNAEHHQFDNTDHHHSLSIMNESKVSQDDSISIILKVSKKRGRRFEEVAKRSSGVLRNYIPVKSTSDVQDVITSIFNKYDTQRMDKSEYDGLKIVLAGNDPFVNDVLKIFVEQLSKKSRAWCLDRIRFYLIPIGINIDLGRHLASLDSTYRSLFFSSEWEQFFESNDTPTPEVVRDIESRVERYTKEATEIYRFEVAEAFITQMINENQHTIKVPFIKGLQIGSINLLALTEEQKEKKKEETNKKRGEKSSSSSSSSAASSSSSPFSTSSSSASTDAKEFIATTTTTSSSAATSNMSSLPSSSSSSETNESSVASNEVELQLDYWVPKKKGGDNQVSIKGCFGFVGVTRFRGICNTWKIDPILRPTPSSFAMMLQFKDKKRGFVKATVAKAGIRHNEGKLQSIPAKINKVTCSTPSAESPPFKVNIDGREWNGVMFLGVSPQWGTHVKSFPVCRFDEWFQEQQQQYDDDDHDDDNGGDHSHDNSFPYSPLTANCATADHS